MIAVERYLGCLVGLAVGDSLGAPFEGVPADHVFWTSGPIGAQLETVGGGQPLAYTDDTEMMIGVAETLLAAGRIELTPLREAFTANYHAERGYGQAACRILEAWQAGDDGEELAETLLPGGSYGNGAAMRVAPVELAFAHDLPRVWSEARTSAWPTHRHPLGIEGAQLLATAVAIVAQQTTFDRRAFYAELIARAESDEFRWQLEAAAKLRGGHTLSFLGNSLPAHRSVVTSIACFTTCPDSYPDTIEKAIALGDDTDTLAAMAGALCGASLGLEAIPPRWIERLEPTEKGRDYIHDLAIQLHTRFG